MTLLFIDTETTGLPENFKAPSSDTANWPRLVQFGYILADDEQHILEQNSFLVRPEGFEIPPEATAIHGISDRYAKKSGVPIELTLMKIELLYNRANVIVGHNVSFDIHVVDAEFCRLKRKPLLERKPKICTMMESINFCDLPHHKYPKLSELHEILFKTGFRNAHNAMADIRATYRCFWRLVSLKVIQLPGSAIPESTISESAISESARPAKVTPHPKAVTESEREAQSMARSFVYLLAGLLVGALVIWICS